MTTLSVVVSAWNEASTIDRCLKSVQWADEIILVDNQSSDKTVAIAQKFTRMIYHRPNNPMLNVSKNYGFTKASGDWILSLDADEEIPKALADEIRFVLGQNAKKSVPSDIVGYWIPRKNIIFGKWIQHGLWWPDEQLRLFLRGKGKFPCVHIHEYLQVDGKTSHLTESYVHYNYTSVSQFIRKMDTLYTNDEVKRLMATGYTFSWYDALRFPLSDFVKIFFAQEGYKDGLHGLVLSMLQGVYSFIVFAKLWEAQGFREQEVALRALEREINHNSRELNYWKLTAEIKQSSNVIHTLWLKLKRRYGMDHNS